MSGPFWGQPPRPAAVTFARLGLAVSILFVLVYVGADAWTARRAARHRVDFSWEASMPFVPQTIWIYSSIYFVFAAIPFVLRSPREIAALAMALTAVILAGAAGFLLLPARLAYPLVPLSGDPVTLALFRASDRLNLEYNLLPSLHVALSSTTLGALATRARATGRLLFAAWAVAIGLSTVFTHQHHVLDVAAGYAVAAAALWLVYRTWSAGSVRSS